MRMGFKGSTTRLAVVVALVLLALCVVAVPLASAAPTVPCLVFGSVQGHFYGGNLALPAEVAVFDPGNANLGETKTSGALFELVVDVPLPLYAATLKVDTETLGPKALDSTKADWTSFFTKNPQSSVEYMYNTSGDFAYSSAVPLVLQVKVTTLIGAVKDAKTKKVLKGVKVTLGKTSVTTSKKGAYTVATQLWPGSKYKATFSKKGYKSVSKSIFGSPTSTQALVVALKRK